MLKRIHILLFICLNFIFSQCPEDLNNDGTANVVDVVTLVNYVLSDDDCVDSNDDGGDACDGIVDECGVCNGNGIPEGECDCSGNVYDCSSVCGGDAIIDACGTCGGNNECLLMALATANLILENVMVNLYSSMSSDTDWDMYYDNIQNDMHPSDIDFTPAYNAYMYALSIDPHNPNANFGAALTSFLMVTQDPILWQVFDEWDNYQGWLIPEDDQLGRISTPNLIKTGLPMSTSDLLSINNMNIFNYLPVSHVFDLADENREVRTFPSISNFQDMIDDVFIARLSQAINYLENVVGKDYHFTITPQMQNDNNQSALEMDDTEFYALKSSLHLLRALLYGINTYHLEGPSPETDFNGDYSWMEVDSEFLTMRSEAVNYLPGLHDDLNMVVSSLQSAYNFVQTETDYQGNDIILWNEISDSENEDILFNQLPDQLNNNVDSEMCDYNWYDMSEECYSVTINIGEFLNNPPSNLKAMIPDYHINVNVEQNDWDWDSEYFDGYLYQNINYPTECSEITNESFCGSYGAMNCYWDSVLNQCEGWIDDWNYDEISCHVNSNLNNCYCSDGISSDQETCESNLSGGTWNAEVPEILGYCSDGTSPDQATCEAVSDCDGDGAAGDLCVWTSGVAGIPSMCYYLDGTYAYDIDQAACESGGVWTCDTDFSEGCFAVEDLFNFAVEVLSEYQSLTNDEISFQISYFPPYMSCENIQNWIWYDDDFDCGDNIGISGYIQGITDYEPCLIFNAADYGNWCNEWDISFNGLFQNMTQWTFINNLLETSESEWLEDQNCD